MSANENISNDTFCGDQTPMAVHIFLCNVTWRNTKTDNCAIIRPFILKTVKLFELLTLVLNVDVIVFMYVCVYLLESPIIKVKRNSFQQDIFIEICSEIELIMEKHSIFLLYSYLCSRAIFNKNAFCKNRCRAFGRLFFWYYIAQLVYTFEKKQTF